ncbi:MAG TPA: RluA family pseudouridine synthase [Geobacterales bacterium]|nr:RluA family pseudouridine synthase [Geobacterales bacterium]
MDQFVPRALPLVTRSACQRLIDEGEITVNGVVVKASHKLRPGDLVCVIIPPPLPAEPLAETIPLEVLYEDHHLIVINKPAGLVVHPAVGNRTGTLVNALLGHCSDLSGIGGELRPGIVHRLDKETSGILVAAKSDEAHQGLARQFKDHTVKRLYLALVFGSPQGEQGHIRGIIGRHPTDRKRMSGKARHGKEAVTHWKVLRRYGSVTLLRLRLETGRTHQIRVHLTESGFPLVGDPVYGGNSRITSLRDQQLVQLIRQLGRQALHATMLGFIHPVTGEYMEYQTDPPEDMARVLAYLEQQSGASAS